MLLHDFIVFLSIGIDLVLPSCLAKPAVITLIEFRKRQKAISFNHRGSTSWQISVYSQTLLRGFLFGFGIRHLEDSLAICICSWIVNYCGFLYTFKKKNNKKFLEISTILVDFKEKLTSMENSIDNITTRCNRNYRTNSS